MLGFGAIGFVYLFRVPWADDLAKLCSFSKTGSHRVDRLARALTQSGRKPDFRCGDEAKIQLSS